MKNTALVLFLIHFYVQLNSQSIKVDWNNRVAYPGVDNNITIVADGIECNHLYVKTDNGIVIPENNDCRFRFIPKKVGDGYFLIYRTENSDTVLLEKHRVRVYPWQDQPAVFANVISGEITRGDFFEHGAVISRITGMDLEGTNEIVSYEIKLIRSKDIIMQLKNIGGALEPDNLHKLEVI